MTQSKIPELDFIKRILSCFVGAEYDLLMWREQTDGTFTFSANVSSTFTWGCPDAEDITEDNLHILEKAKADIVAVDSDELYAVADLFAARVRSMRPQGAAARHYSSALLELFAALPERPTDLNYPYIWPRMPDSV